MKPILFVIIVFVALGCQRKPYALFQKTAQPTVVSAVKVPPIGIETASLSNELVVLPVIVDTLISQPEVQIKVVESIDLMEKDTVRSEATQKKQTVQKTELNVLPMGKYDKMSRNSRTFGILSLVCIVLGFILIPPIAATATGWFGPLVYTILGIAVTYTLVSIFSWLAIIFGVKSKSKAINPKPAKTGLTTGLIAKGITFILSSIVRILSERKP